MKLATIWTFYFSASAGGPVIAVTPDYIVRLPADDVVVRMPADDVVVLIPAA